MIDNASLFNNLDHLTVKNKDNGKCFTKTTRLDRIEELLMNSSFTFMKKAGLFYAFSQIPFNDLNDDTLIISSHVDFRKGTKKCFSDTTGKKKVIGTYDNSATNAAIVELMLHEELPKNTLVVFTGDEEVNARGAAAVVNFVWELGINASCIVLDVTEEGYKAKAAFSIENAYCDDALLRKVIDWMVKQDEKYFFVPAEEKQKKNELVVQMLPKEYVSDTLAETDESEEYGNKGIKCFSFCLPTKLMDPDGRFAPDNDPEEAMHSCKGLKIRRKSFVGYTKALAGLINYLNVRGR